MKIESPLLQEMMAKASAQCRQKMILRLLARRFGDVPEEVHAAIQAISHEPYLEQLVQEAAFCPDVQTFRKSLELCQLMIESSLVQRIIANTAADSMHKCIVRVLSRRFGQVADEVVEAVRAIEEEWKLDEMLDEAISCPNRHTFWIWLEELAKL